MDKILPAVLCAMIPIPGLLYLGPAVFLREGIFKTTPERNTFAAVNGMIVAISLALLIGAIPGCIYVLHFFSLWGSGPSPDPVLTPTLLIGGPIAAASVLGTLAFRKRLSFIDIESSITSGSRPLPCPLPPSPTSRRTSRCLRFSTEGI